MLFVAICFSAIARAQDPPPPPAGSDITEERLLERKQALESQEQTESVSEAIGLYDHAIASLKEALTAEASAKQFEQDRQNVQNELTTVRQELEQSLDSEISPPLGATIEQLRRLYDEAKQSLTSAQDRVRQLEAESANRQRALADAPVTREQLQSDLTSVQSELQATAPPDTPPYLTEARQASLATKQRSILARLDELDKRIANYDARVELLPLRIQKWQRLVTQAEEKERKWREHVAHRESELALDEVRAAETALAETSEPLKPLAEKALQLAQARAGRTGYLARKDEARRTFEQITENELKPWIDRFEQAKARAIAARHANLPESHLRNERLQLPDIRRVESRIKERRDEMGEIGIALSDYRYELRALPSVGQKMQELNTLIGVPQTEAETTTRRDEVERRLRDLRSQYDKMIRTLEEYERALVNAQDVDVQLARLIEEFRDFIDARILWIPSTLYLRWEDLRIAGQSLGQFLNPGNWLAAAGALWSDLLARPGLHFLALLLFGAVFGVRPIMRRRLKEFNEKVQRASTDRMFYTARACIITAIYAATWPLVFWHLGWRLSAAAEADFSGMVGAGLLSAGNLLLLITLLWHLCRRYGLGESHFNWRDRTRVLIRRTLHWAGAALVVGHFLVTAVEQQSGGAANEPLSRIAFLLVMLVLAVALAQLVHPTRGIVEGLLRQHRGGWTDRLRWFWYGGLVLLPIGLAVAATIGYYYTAQQLESRLLHTIWLLLLVMIANGFVLRWLLLARRRMAIEEARRRRAAAKAESPSAEVAQIPLDEPKVDVRAIDTQARQLVRTTLVCTLLVGLWLIWSQMLPALSILERVHLWPDFGIAAEETLPAGTSLALNQLVTESAIPAPAETSNGAAPANQMPNTGATPTDSSSPLGTLQGQQLTETSADATTGGQADVVTLGNLLIAIIILAISITLSRNLPGLLEITILQRLPLEPSGRYAITSLARYALIIVGVVLAFGAIGIGWSKVQFLAAAITVGLGFGLQEIFANFVSGVIILFERPVRVGDVVTIGNISGTVTRIRMRATTISDWDRKELVIPNKEFVTGQIINWTLSDPILRVRVPVGIAYGSDTRKAKETLLHIAKANHRTLDDPAPQALFLGFGASSLDFELRVFIPSIDHWVPINHELHQAIDDAFREAKIEIAFPQRDIHIRSIHSQVEIAAPPPPHGT